LIRYLISEAKIAVPWGFLLVPLLIAILRLTKVVSPEVPEAWRGWISFLEFTFPILFPLLTFGLLEQEKRWRTLEVMVATRKHKAPIFLVRYSLLLFPLFLAVAAAVRPGEYLLVMAPGLALGGAALLLGLILGDETGLGLALGWWGFSFAIAVARPELLSSGPFSWIVLTLTGAPLSPSAILLRKWVHFGAGLVFFFLALAVAERKRTWSAR
jgi:hypothetical protein